MRKYIILFLFICSVSNAQYNLFAKQNFAYKTVAIGTNTEIGGVASTISTPALLATKLGIDVSRITNFAIVGSGIKCRITGGYFTPFDAFNLDTNVTYYNDIEGLVSKCIRFVNCSNFIEDIDFNNALSVDASHISYNTKSTLIRLPNCTSVIGDSFNSIGETIPLRRQFYLPNCVIYGASPSVNNNVFAGILSGSKIYAHPSMETINGGDVEADLAYAITQGAVIRYVNSFTAPLTPTLTSIGTIYNTAVQLVDAGGSTNAIDYYEVTVNGVPYGNVNVGSYITGLTPSTSYNITIKAVDIFYNKSVVSSSFSVSTTSDLSDTDATAYTTASSNTTYQYVINDLFKGLKDNSLYTKLQAFYPFLGTTAAQHKWNGKNPIDTDGAFRLTFTGAATFSNNGYQLNGSSYANTYFAPSAQQSLNSNGITVVVGTNNAAAGADVVEIGAYNSGTQKSYVVAKNNNTNYNRVVGLNSANAIQSGVNESRGVFTGTKQSSTVTDLFVNGVQTATASGGGTLPTINIFIGAMNLNGSAYGNSNQRIQFVAIHEGLSDAEVATLHTIIDNFETALGRKTW